MKHIFKTFVTFTLITALLMAISVTSYSKANEVYYPVSGSSSEYVQNAIRGKVLQFDKLPAGVIHINYVTDTPVTLQLRFYTNSNLTGGFSKADLGNYPNGHSTTVSLPAYGTYYVVVYTNNNIVSSFTYAYDLYTN